MAPVVWMWKEAVVAHFKALPRLVPRGTKEDHKYIKGIIYSFYRRVHKNAKSDY
jgi:hypothetical protein